MIKAPLEQFQILSLIPLKLYNLDFSITNFLLINLVLLVLVFFIVYVNNSKFELSIFYCFGHKCKNFKENSFYLMANSWQKSLETFTHMGAQLVNDIIANNKERYLPIISMLLNYILLSNLIGLVPYSFTTTSHLIVTFTLSFSVFIGINIITIQKYGIKTFSLFLPSNTTFVLALLLIPIELISYIAKPISLGVRLFINLMAGHSLLKVIVGFS